MPDVDGQGVADGSQHQGLTGWVRDPGCGTVLGAFASGLLLAVVSAGVGSLLTDSLSASLLFLEIGLIGGVAIYLVATGHRLGEAFRARPVAVSAYPLALLLGIALLFANSSATVLLGPSTRDIELVTSAGSLAERMIMALTVAIAAPIVEEALFRGLLQGVLERRLRPWVAIVGAALPFAAMHGPQAAIFFFFWSIPLGWIAYRIGSIRPGIVVHAVNNLVGLIGLLAAGSVDPAALEADSSYVPIALVILPAAALWAAYLCRRIAEVAGPGPVESMEPKWP